MSEYVLWFDDKESVTFDYLARLALAVGVSYEDEIEFEQYVEDTFGSTLIRDTYEGTDFNQWIGMQFKTEQDMIMFILKAGSE